MYIALILVGGFGTRLRPLVCTPRAEKSPRPTCDPFAHYACGIDLDASETSGGVWEPTHDPAPGRELGCRGCN